jgi:hypothetical protein
MRKGEQPKGMQGRAEGGGYPQTTAPIRRDSDSSNKATSHQRSRRPQDEESV